MAHNAGYRRLVEQSPSYTLHFLIENIGGVPQTGQAAAMDIWRARERETPAVQIMNAGVAVGTQTVVEVDATNMPGVYELQLDTGDLDRPGALTLLVQTTLGEDNYIFCDVYSRSGAF